jgi:hypothetical protein
MADIHAGLQRPNLRICYDSAITKAKEIGDETAEFVWFDRPEREVITGDHVILRIGDKIVSDTKNAPNATKEVFRMSYGEFLRRMGSQIQEGNMKLSTKKVRLIKDISTRLPDVRVPEVGAIGTVLKTPSGGAAIRWQTDGAALVKFPGRNGPISLAKDEYTMLKESTEHPIFQKIREGTVTADDFNRLIQEATPESARDRLRRRQNHTQDTVRSHQDDDGHSDLKLPVMADRVQPKRERADRTQMQHGGKMGHRHSARTQRRTMSKSLREFDLTFDKIGYVNNLHEEMQKRGYQENNDYAIEVHGGSVVLKVTESVEFDQNLKEWLTHVGRAKRLDIDQVDIFESASRYKKALLYFQENIGRPIDDKLLSEIEDADTFRTVAIKLMGKPGVNRDWLSDFCDSLQESARRLKARTQKKSVAAAKEMGSRGHVGLYGPNRDPDKRKGVADILRAKRRGETTYQKPFYE